MRHIFISLKWVLLSFIFIPISLYLIIILINLNDEAPSKQSIENLAKIEANNLRLTNNLIENGYIFTLGFDVEKSASPKEIGLARFQQLQDISIMESTKKFSSERFEIPKLSIQQCINKNDFTEQCSGVLIQDSELTLQLKEFGWLIDRYQQLINQKDWQDGTYFNVFIDQIPASSLLTAQKLYLLNIYVKTSEMDSNQIAKAINQDMIFWQKISSNTHFLLTKVISNAGIDTNMRLGEIIISPLITANSTNQIPKTWLKTLPPKVLSLDKVKLGEWYFFMGMTEATKVDDKANIASHFFEWLLLPLFQHQDTANLYAEALIHNSTQQHCPDKFTFDLISDYSYNPVGKFILCSSSPSFNMYQKALDDLENKRVKLLSNLNLSTL
ncbi:hypothetical protein [Shewanella goraebulensis]|uniref:hypothetical protein n=1 Tax=Shewanella goraebulensis TaxID=3050637 RepID=UPI00254A6194|nr:hypothetical protein [Shewanella goraebulensis]